jgi:aspartate/methionine/tyrosine aminotransferase
LAEQVARCAKGRNMVTETFARLPRVRYAPPEGAFYAFFAVEGENDARALAFKLVDRANVGLAPGTAFGPGAPNFLRLCFACSLDRLGEGLARLEKALK